MSNFTGFTIDAAHLDGGLASSALPNAPMVAEPDRPPRRGIREIASAGLLRVAFGSAALAYRIEPRHTPGSLAM